MDRRRFVILVADSAGCGALPDAGAYGDDGSNTIGNVSRAVGGLALPVMGRMGLGRLTPILGVPPDPAPVALHGRMAERYPGILGVGYAVLIRPKDLAKHIASIRSQGFPAYTVSPPGIRELYTSIIYLEPFSGRNLRAFGYDMFLEPVRREAMERARDSGPGRILDHQLPVTRGERQKMQPAALAPDQPNHGALNLKSLLLDCRAQFGAGSLRYVSARAAQSEPTADGSPAIRSVKEAGPLKGR